MKTSNEVVASSESNATFFSLNLKYRKILFIVGILLCSSTFLSPAFALFLGLFFAQCIGHPYMHLNRKATKVLLQGSVIGLGFGMNIVSAMEVGSEGLIFTVISIFGTLTIGLLLGKFFKVEKKIAYLISCGTAICGGSAIAAVAPVIKAHEKEISVGLGVVFILNAVALFIFPPIGHALALSQEQFGLWSAIAIHDTSSVVGAASQYGPEALKVAVTVKLVRALWIIPVAFLSTFLFKNKQKKISIPWFIGFFILAMILNTYLPVIQDFSGYIVVIAKAGLTLTLFLIGAGLSRKVVRSVGFRPFVQGVLLWILIASVALWAVFNFA